MLVRLAYGESGLDVEFDDEARPRTVPDQWQVQIQARIQSRCRVVMHTSSLSDDDLAAAHLTQTADVGAAVAKALAEAGPGARACVLPEGPQTIPYVDPAAAGTLA